MPELLHCKYIHNVICFLLISLSPCVLSADPVLIHHPQLQGEDFSTNSLLRIYAIQKKIWSDGTPVKVFALPNSSNVHKQFVKEYLRMQPYQLSRLWHRLVFSGTGSIPVEISSDRLMLEKVKNTVGAIGYVDSSIVDQIDQSMMSGASHE